jgi:hypothetical protein
MRALVLAAIAVAACNPQRAFTRCDLLQESCRGAIAHATQKLRGGAGTLPPIQVRSEDEVVADSTSQTTQAQRDQFARENALLALFDLSTPGLTLAAQTQNHFDGVAAFYSPSTKTVTVIDRGQPLDDEQSVVILAHELVHALQDQDGFLGRSTATSDAELAYSSVIEGEATVYQDLASFDIFGWQDRDIDWSGSFTHYQGVEDADAINSATPAYDASLDFVYPYGGAYVLERYRHGGQEAISAIYDAVPPSTFEVVNGFAVTPTTATIAAPAGYTIANSDSLGWWLFNVWCARQGVDGCSDMLTDTFAQLAGPTTAGIWQLHFADGTDVASLRSQIPTTYTTSIVNGDLIISRGTGASLVTGARSSLR